MATTAPIRAKAKVMTLTQRPIAQADDSRDVDVVRQRAGLLGIQHRGLAGLHHVLLAAHGVCRIGGDNLAGELRYAGCYVQKRAEPRSVRAKAAAAIDRTVPSCATEAHDRASTARCVDAAGGTQCNIPIPNLPSSTT
jgi:hypothetical protein